MAMVQQASVIEVFSDRPVAALGALPNFSPSSEFKGLTSTKVRVDGKEEEVFLDSEGGPLMLRRDGSTTFAYVRYSEAGYSGGSSHGFDKCWRYMTSTEQKVLVNLVAKLNRRTKESM
mmetsp:Transcript_47979/g.98988  ORF Transcript_47979/g.98988 Transcript_47979/m.98988 type:complete len:118 (+) Transcript_47979:1-354(+)